MNKFEKNKFISEFDIGLEEKRLKTRKEAGSSYSVRRNKEYFT